MNYISVMTNTYHTCYSGILVKVHVPIAGDEVELITTYVLDLDLFYLVTKKASCL